MSLWRLHSSFSETTFKQTTTAPIIALIGTADEYSSRSSPLATWIRLSWSTSFRSEDSSFTPPNWVPSTLIPCSHISLPRRTLSQHRCWSGQGWQISSSEAGDSISTLSLPRTSFHHHPLILQQRQTSLLVRWWIMSRVISTLSTNSSSFDQSH